MHAIDRDASVKFDVVEWDYTQRYPIEGGGDTVEEATIVDNEGESPKAGAANSDSGGKPEFHADVTANGAITVAM